MQLVLPAPLSRGDAIGATAGAHQDVIGPPDGGARQHAPKDLEFRSAQSLTGARRRADRAVVLDQQQAAVRLRDALGHITFLATQGREAAYPLRDPACALHGVAVAGQGLALALRDQPVETSR